LKISIRDRLILENKRFVESVRSKSSDQQADDRQTIDQQSVDDLIQLLIEFKIFDISRSSFKNESVEYSFLSKTSSMFDVSNSSSSSSKKRSFDKRFLKRERSDVESSRSQKKTVDDSLIESSEDVAQQTIDAKSIKRTLSHLNLTDRIEEMKKRHQFKRNVASIDVDQANIVKEKRVKFVSSKYSKFDYAQLA
jgi:hypothetical protein